jgi:hypothetical protein
VKKDENDLRVRREAVPEVAAKLKVQYQEAKEAKRTASAYSVWNDELISLVWVAWILSRLSSSFRRGLNPRGIHLDDSFTGN